MNEKILVVDDEAEARKLVQIVLKDENYDVAAVPSTEDALKELAHNQFDLLLLDLRVPKLGGLKLCEMLRINANTKNMLIIMVTSCGSDSDKIIGLNTGADDYITKPFNRDELIARIKSLLRRSSRVENTRDISQASTMGLDIDVIRKSALVDGKQISLRPKEYEVLLSLLSNKGKVVPFSEIIERIWGKGSEEKPERVISICNDLKAKVGADASVIEVVQNAGLVIRI